jgi:hypothetical protein
MKKLVALFLLFVIVGCEKEPSLLEKCLETNINIFETTSTGDNLKIVFKPDFNLYIKYMSTAYIEGNNNWCFFDFVDRNECENLEPEIFFSKYGNGLYSDSKNSYEQFTVKDVKEILAIPDGSGLGTELHRQLLNDTYDINARLKCSEQGIY